MPTPEPSPAPPYGLPSLVHADAPDDAPHHPSARARGTGSILIALGGNAMVGPDGSATPQAQQAAIAVAMESVACVVASGLQVVVTHGNGPQVGNLLAKNELAAHVLPPVPLDWCGAQTQGTLGFTITSALEAALRRRDCGVPVAAVVTRTLVAATDPAFGHPTKPVGRFLPRAEAEALVALGQHWEDRGAKGWRRVVPSPEPLSVLDAPAVHTLLAAGFVAVAAGGGGIPVVRTESGAVHGVEAVLDKDLTAALLATELGADVLVIATDVPYAMVDFGTEHERPIERVTPRELRAYAADGQFAGGSMGPKIEAAARFVEAGGRRAVVTSLERIADAVEGRAGTVVEV
ncbi:carbamate kinase [Yinghuangia seranimata]|uniref:carbamate kinase n=1 Tax=Yinghuangia seranimata TaxID=408067 RepID=UPI00248BDCED|nr:carbamate kinase [Yinghuangia seranimata]MDI2124719.1 carbamate kinase [Yinghuangia seranimata]